MREKKKMKKKVKYEVCLSYVSPIVKKSHTQLIPFIHMYTKLVAAN